MVQIRTIAIMATNMLECKKGANFSQERMILLFLLSVLTSDWLKQQIKLTHKAVHIFTFQPSSIHLQPIFWFQFE